MSLSELQRQSLGRRSVRARIGLACAGLFLVTGGAFVAATYAVIDHSLGPAANQPDFRTDGVSTPGLQSREFERHAHGRPGGPVSTILSGSRPVPAGVLPP